MKDEITIKVEDVYKNFILPHERVTSLKSAFTGLTKKRKKIKETQHALQGISFEVKKGEFFGIVGRNGSGKSTLLKILAGIYQPTKGAVSVRGKLVPFIELGVGFNPELTGRDNVYLNGSMLGFSSKEIDGMYQSIVEFAELEQFMDQKLKNYSSGMQVRLAFSMAIRAEADILLIDEVLAVGDADFQRKCFDYFKKLKRNKKTVVFVSHDMNAVREYCNRALLIDDSKVVSMGSATKVAGEYARLFIKEKAPDKKPRDNKTRWGEGTAAIVKPKISVSQDNILQLTFNVSCKADIEDPILGYYFTNTEGRQVCGTNTQLLEIKLLGFESGKQYKASFEMENIFSDGTFTATLAVLKDNGTTVVDWWEDAISVDIVKTQHVPFLVDAPVKAHIGEHV